jgi:enamine deaminase RidA (YjgF/YER057c/UK114 family)
MPASGETAHYGAWEERLSTLGLVLPQPPTPLGSCATASQVGALLFLSGMLPLINGRLAVKGRIGAEVSLQQGRQAVLIALLNGLAVARRFFGQAEAIERVVRMGVSIAAIPEFTQHAAVADGASETLDQIFAGAPRHVRLVAGVQSLALGAPVALEMIFAVRPAAG